MIRKLFLKRPTSLAAQGVEVTPERVLVSSRAHLILPYHRALDHTSEERLGNERVGTTLRGIGPAYEDKAGRRGIRVADALVPEVSALAHRAQSGRRQSHHRRLRWRSAGCRSDFRRDLALCRATRAVHRRHDAFHEPAAREGRSILIEGAQATLLDVDHGTYPFVTSSSTTAGGASIGTGLAPHRITGVLGIVRTYTTRVGEGPFPTEMLEGEEELGQLIRERGREYGAVTQAPAPLRLVRRFRHALCG